MRTGARIAAVRFVLLATAALFAAVAVLPGCNASCKPQEVHGVQMLCGGGAKGYIWTGTSCIFTSVCNCTGPDCQRLYSTQDGCETAHIHCR
jgi:hypothetical protein